MRPYSTRYADMAADWFFCGVGLGEEDALSCGNLWHSEKDALEAYPLSGKFQVSEGFLTLSPPLLVWFTVKCCAP